MIRRVFLSLCLCLSAATAWANPVLDGADPHAIASRGAWWIYPTESRSRAPVFAAYRSTDLKTWSRTGTILELGKIPWIAEDGAPKHTAWAPAMVEKGGKFYFYYSVGPQNPTPSRIGVAVCDSPDGKFVDSGKPLITGGRGFEAIDPMVFIDPKDGRALLYAGGSAGATLRIYELEADMVRVKRQIESPQPEKFTEGAFMHRRGSTYYLSYSHGRWNDGSYSVHYSTAPAATGPWRYRGPILESDSRHQGPGHHSFIENAATREWFIVYHRWETEQKTGPFRGGRKIAIEKITYDAKGLIRPVKMSDGPTPVSRLRKTP